MSFKKRNRNNNPAAANPASASAASAGLFFMFLFLILTLVPARAQECDGTQFKTDDRGLVFVPKGEKEKLLIGGVWCICEGCGDCVPVSNPEQPTAPSRLRSRQARRQQDPRELADQRTMELMERTKELIGQVEREDEARLQAEHNAFQDRVSLLVRELKSLQTESLAQYNGLKLKLQDLAERAATIKEIGNIAYWSLEAAANAYNGESARIRAGWGFDDWQHAVRPPDLSRFNLEVPVPETQTPQFAAFKYIADWAGDMYTKLLRLTEMKEETENKGREFQLKRFNEFEPAPLTTRPTEEEKKKQEYLADLEKQAQALLKEAEQMSDKATEYLKEVSNMQGEFFQLVNDPSKCAEFLERHSGKK